MNFLTVQMFRVKCDCKKSTLSIPSTPPSPFSFCYTPPPHPSRTLLIGSGSPPAEFLSPLVIVMMAVGLGVPLLLLLVGGACVCIRKRASPANYQPIN